MDSNIVECDLGREVCVCRQGTTLGVLKDVQRLYEERLALVERVGGVNKLQNQVGVLRSWVGDLVEQNTLLARAVEDLETEATSALLLEKRRHAEREKKRKCSNPNELKLLNDKLQKENVAKDREIRRLNKDAQQYEQTIINLRNEMSICSKCDINVSKKDAEVMAGISWSGHECGDWEPVRECSVSREELLKYQERIHKMETSLKDSSASLKALRKVNVALNEEVISLRRVCGVLHEQCHATALRTQFKEDIIREMRHQLKNAKTKIKEMSEIRSTAKKDYVNGDDFPQGSVSYDSVTIACVRQQPRRAPFTDDTSPRLDGSGDDILAMRVDSP